MKQFLTATPQSHEPKPHGPFLTIYINKQDPMGPTQALMAQVEQAKTLLSHAFTPQQIQNFLEPISKLLKSPSLLFKFKNNIAIFRNNVSFQLINLPAETKTMCIVASSFHIKPLLKFKQENQDFYIVALNFNKIELIHGDLHSFRKVHSIPLPSVFGLTEVQNMESADRFNNLKIQKKYFSILQSSQPYLWIQDWLETNTDLNKNQFFVTGNDILVQLFIENIEKIRFHWLQNFYIETELQSLLCQARLKIKNQIEKQLAATLMEYQYANQSGLLKKNIFQVAKAALDGRIKKLIVAEDMTIWGKLNSHTGGLILNPVQTDHEDDDILDDIAQLVLQNGGEVIVQPYEEMPQKRPALAILKGQDYRQSVADHRLLAV